MPDVTVALPLTALIALAVWLAGSLALRILGVALVMTGLIGAVTTTNAAGLLVAVLGVSLWLAGHWLYAVRHHEFVSPLARRCFIQTPLRRLDPTRGWGIPTVPDQPHGRQR